MYNLPHFKEQDEKVVMEFIHQHPFALLTGATPDGRPVATQVPVFIEERERKLYLTGHIQRKSDHHLAMEANPQVLCVFTGAHTYVSASWYSDPHQASTWNYQSVHVRGKVSFLKEEALVEILKKLTLHYESGNTESPTVFDNLSPEYTSRLMKAIVAFDIEVEDIQHVFKLSQNRDKESYQHIINKLNTQDADGKAIAEEMRKRESKLFGS